MAKKNTDLKLSVVKQKAEQMHKLHKYELEDGSTITHYISFPDLIIESLLEELQKHYATMKEKEIELSEKMNLYFINLLIIKYFTHFSKDMPDHLLAVGKKAGLLDWLNDFADTSLMNTIMDEVLMKDQVMKVYDKLTAFVGTSLLLNELSEKTQKHLENMRFKHSDELNKFDNNIVQ